MVAYGLAGTLDFMSLPQTASTNMLYVQVVSASLQSVILKTGSKIFCRPCLHLLVRTCSSNRCSQLTSPLQRLRCIVFGGSSLPCGAAACINKRAKQSTYVYIVINMVVLSMRGAMQVYAALQKYMRENRQHQGNAE